jgi:hypothetical protein
VIDSYQLLLSLFATLGDLLLMVLGWGWEFTKGFVMPAAAILTSGLVAIWLQRRDHAKREIERKENLAAERAERLKAAKQDLVRHAIRSNEPWAEYVQEPSNEARARLALRLTASPAEWYLSDVEDARGVGAWLDQCRTLLISYYVKHPLLEGVDSTEPILFVFDINYALLDWSDGRKPASWFESERARIYDTQSTFEDEAARLGAHRKQSK